MNGKPDLDARMGCEVMRLKENAAETIQNFRVLRRCGEIPASPQPLLFKYYVTLQKQLGAFVQRKIHMETRGKGVLHPNERGGLSRAALRSRMVLTPLERGQMTQSWNEYHIHRPICHILSSQGRYDNQHESYFTFH
jgi:hypothetical protein